MFVYHLFPLAIHVYRQIKNVAMVASLQDIKVTLKKVLLFHFVVTFTGNWGQKFTGWIYCHVHKQLQFSSRLISCLLHARGSTTGTWCAVCFIRVFLVIALMYCCCCVNSCTVDVSWFVAVGSNFRAGQDTGLWSVTVYQLWVCPATGVYVSYSWDFICNNITVYIVFFL